MEGKEGINQKFDQLLIHVLTDMYWLHWNCLVSEHYSFNQKLWRKGLIVHEEVLLNQLQSKELQCRMSPARATSSFSALCFWLHWLSQRMYNTHVSCFKMHMHGNSKVHTGFLRDPFESRDASWEEQEASQEKWHVSWEKWEASCETVVTYICTFWAVL